MSFVKSGPSCQRWWYWTMTVANRDDDWQENTRMWLYWHTHTVILVLTFYILACMLHHRLILRVKKKNPQSAASQADDVPENGKFLYWITAWVLCGNNGVGERVGEVRWGWEEGRGDLHVLNYSAFKPQEDKNGVKWGDKLWTLKKKTVAFDTRQTRILNSMKYNFLMKYLCNTHLILHIFMHMVLFLWSEQEMFKTSLWRQTPLL